MALRRKVVVAGLAAGAVLLATVGSAFAAAPPYEPDQGSIGGLIFYNSAGTQITTGSISTGPFAAYVEATTPGRAGDSKATLYEYTPKIGVATAGWSGQAFGLSPSYPISNPPTTALGTTLPVYTAATTDSTLASLEGIYPNTDTSTDGYAGLYQIRLYTSGPGQPSGANYDSADISVNTTSDTWTEVYSLDGPPTATTTTLGTPSPTSPVTVGTYGASQSVALSATVSPTSAVGTVQFLNGGSALGSPVTVTSGSASTTANLAAGTYSLTAEFIPENSGLTNPVTDPTPDFSTSTSAATPYQVNNPGATATQTSLGVNTGTGAALSPVTFTATVTPAAAGGTVTFVDVFTPPSGPTTTTTLDTTASGATTFTYTTSALAQGSHSVTATFNPGVPAQYATSSNTASAFILTAATYTPAVGNITATIQAGTLLISTPYTPSAPLALGALQLNPAGTLFSGSVAFGAPGTATGQSQTDGLSMIDTRAGDLPWTASGLASSLTGTPNGTISGENVGLTNVAPDFVSGNALNAATTFPVVSNLTLYDNPAAPGVAPGDTGSAGLGGTGFHEIAHADQGLGTVGFYGTITVNAPTSTPAGPYAGTVTFTIIGS